MSRSRERADQSLDEPTEAHLGPTARKSDALPIAGRRTADPVSTKSDPRRRLVFSCDLGDLVVVTMSTDTDARRLRWDACYNTRDLGGLPTDGSRRTRWRGVVRSDNLARLTFHGRTALVRYGIRTVIDLRGIDEHGLEHDLFSRAEMIGTERLALPLLSDEFATRYRQREVAGHDFDLLVLQTSGPNIARIFDAIASAPDGGVLFYCHAGKERTGLVAALLLASVGVAPAVIAGEHSASDRYLAPLYEAWFADFSSAERETRRQSLLTDPAQMEQTLDYLDHSYGGILPYLIGVGVSQDQLHRIQERLLD